MSATPTRCSASRRWVLLLRGHALQQHAVAFSGAVVCAALLGERVYNRTEIDRHRQDTERQRFRDRETGAEKHHD